MVRRLADGAVCHLMTPYSSHFYHSRCASAPYTRVCAICTQPTLELYHVMGLQSCWRLCCCVSIACVPNWGLQTVTGCAVAASYQRISAVSQMTPLPGEVLEEAYHDVVNVVPTKARAIAALLRETSDRASVSYAVRNCPRRSAPCCASAAPCLHETDFVGWCLPLGGGRTATACFSTGPIIQRHMCRGSSQSAPHLPLSGPLKRTVHCI